MSWQQAEVERLSLLFRRKRQAKAVILYGSLAGDEALVDEWSDVDMKVILSESLIDSFFQSTRWLAPTNDIIAVDRRTHGPVRTLRVCLTPFRRFDLTFIPVSCMKQIASLGSEALHRPYAVLWSRMPRLQELLASVRPQAAIAAYDSDQIDRLAEVFWFKATIAISKVVRNDLLVALHLALDLARDCLLLQMILRDRALGTNVHRTGGFGNEICPKLRVRAQANFGLEALKMIRTYGPLFDSLASQLSPNYERRHDKLLAALERAEAHLKQKGTRA